LAGGDSGGATKYPKVESMLVMSGGEGYIDFRIGDTESESAECGRDKQGQGGGKGDRSHLVVWQVNLPQPARARVESQLNLN